MVVSESGNVSSNLDGASRPDDDSEATNPAAGANALSAAGAAPPSPTHSSSTPPADEQVGDDEHGWHMVSLWQWIMLALVFIGPLIVMGIYAVIRFQIFR